MRQIFLLTCLFLLTNIRVKECFAQAGGFASLMPVFIQSQLCCTYLLQCIYFPPHAYVGTAIKFCDIIPRTFSFPMSPPPFPSFFLYSQLCSFALPPEILKFNSQVPQSIEFYALFEVIFSVWFTKLLVDLRDSFMKDTQVYICTQIRGIHTLFQTDHFRLYQYTNQNKSWCMIGYVSILILCSENTIIYI